jgi:chromate transporter
VILNLALWFALHALFGRVIERPLPLGALDVPVWTSVNLPALLLTLAAAVAIFRFRVGMLPALGGCAAIGIVLRLAGIA